MPPPLPRCLPLRPVRVWLSLQGRHSTWQPCMVTCHRTWAATISNHLGVPGNAGWRWMVIEKWCGGILDDFRVPFFQTDHFLNSKLGGCILWFQLHVFFSAEKSHSNYWEKLRFSNSILQPCSCHSDVRSVAKLTTSCSCWLVGVTSWLLPFGDSNTKRKSELWMWTYGINRPKRMIFIDFQLPHLIMRVYSKSTLW